MSIIESLLSRAREKGASDIHLIPGLPPVLRIDGRIVPQEIGGIAGVGTDSASLTRSLLNPRQWEELQKERHLGFALMFPGVGRVRVEAFYSMGQLGAAIRLAAIEPPRLEDLGAPPVLESLTRSPAGLVLVTGPTGAGKTTTLNAMVDFVNRERSCKIITIEDPIEFVHRPKRSVIVQQEVHDDTPAFATALIHVLRQDPDVIVVGEMRSLDTIQTALTAAETGHLVLATLHTNNAAQTVDRIVDVFPPHQQNQVRVQLAASLDAILSQRLLPRVDGKGRVLACEMLVNCPAVRNIIRDNRTQQLASTMQSNADLGMCTMDSSVLKLYHAGIISYDTARDHLENPSQLDRRGGSGL